MRLVLTLLTIASALAATQATASAQRVEPVAGMVGEADAIVAGPDGALWASQTDDPGRIARITTGGEVTYAAVGGISGLPVNRGPAGITRHGNELWFMLTSGPETFAQMVPRGATTRSSLSYGRPTSLASGPDGALWMTVDGGSGSPDAILRRDPVESFFLLGADVDPHAIVAGPDGALWFLENGRIGRATTSGVISYQSVGATPTALAVGADRALWYAQGATVRRLGDPAVYAIGSPVTALAAGADGAMWAAVRGGLARIVPGEAPAFVREGIDPDAQGRALTATPDGRLWLTLDRAPYLVRITLELPPAGPPTPTEALPPSPAASPTPTPAPAGAVEGKSVEVRVLSGTISYRVPPSTTTADHRTATLPIGVLLDTTPAGSAWSLRRTAPRSSVTSSAASSRHPDMHRHDRIRARRAAVLHRERNERWPLAARARKRSGARSGARTAAARSARAATAASRRSAAPNGARRTPAPARRSTCARGPSRCGRRRGGRSKLVRAGQRRFTPRPR